MRLDSLGKPPILQIVPEPKKAKGPNQSVLSTQEVKQVADSPEGSFSRGQEKLGQILEILARSKRDSKNKKAKAQVLKGIQEYQRVEKTFQQEWNFDQKQRGDKLDIQG